MKLDGGQRRGSEPDETMRRRRSVTWGVEDAVAVAVMEGHRNLLRLGG
jgi:hypothetical protein